MGLAGSQRRPLLMAIEDLHWLDTTSEAYLALLVESLAGAAIHAAHYVSARLSPPVAR